MNNEKKIVEKIRADYEERQTTKLDELKSLDKRVKRPADIFAYTYGVVGALVLGFGMCMAMQVLFSAMAWGIVIGVAGIAMVCTTYPIYKTILKTRKQKYAQEIFALSDSILHE